MIKTNAINNENLYPENPEFFKEEEVSGFLNIGDLDPDIEAINSIKLWPEVQDVKIVETEVGISNEGQVLTGVKLVVVVKINEKITYSARNKEIPIHILYNEFYKNFCIVVKPRLKDLDVSALMRAGRIHITPYIEGAYARKFNDRRIYKSTVIFVEARIC